VAIEDDAGNPVTYGVVADISGGGACVWTERPLLVGSTLSFRISFADVQPDVHDLVGIVVWSEVWCELPERGGRRAGIEWLFASRACRERLRQLAGLAVPPTEVETFPFQARWRVGARVPHDEA
jgi:hypothetical protein